MNSQPPSPPELLVVMPAYNEEAAIEPVLREWCDAVCAQQIRAEFLLIDDGSTDHTAERVQALQSELKLPVELLRQENRGHGQTCLRGYRTALERDVPWILQVDSDGQCDPGYFAALWGKRAQADVVYGVRVRRDDGSQRKLASLVLRGTLLAASGVNCPDANTPYRLMRTRSIAPGLQTIPPEFFLANVALAVQLRRQPGVTHDYLPIRFRARRGGTSSVPLRSFGFRALELVKQLRALPRPETL